MINGRAYDWESVKVTLPTGHAVEVRAIHWRDARAVTPLHGQDAFPIAVRRGKYEASGDFEVTKEGFEDLVTYANLTGVGLYELPPFPIVVSAGNGDQPLITRTLPSCKITGIDEGHGQGDKASAVRVTFAILQKIQRGVELAGVFA